MSQIPSSPSLAPAPPPVNHGGNSLDSNEVASNATPPATPKNQTPSAPVATLPPQTDPTAISLAPVTPAAGNDELNLKDAFTKAGLDPRKIADEYNQTGGVSDETIRLIQASDPKIKLLGKDLIRDHIEGQAARHLLRIQRVESATKAATEVAGGESQLEQLKTWFAANQPARVKSFEAMLKNDPSVYPDIVRIMDAEYKAKAGAGGTAPIIQGQATVPGGNKPGNAQEMAALMGRVSSGDRAAMAILQSMTNEEIARIR